MIERLEPQPDDAAGALRARGLSPNPWSARPGTVFARHDHERTKRLYVINGSISFDGLELRRGEGILIPAGTPHSAMVGDGGVECVEAFE
jgi:hypothetical protein